MAPAELQLVLTSGPEDADRAKLALHTGLAGLATGLTVTVFFTLRATHWACSIRPEHPANAEIEGLLEKVRQLGGALECCSACAETHCETPLEPAVGGSTKLRAGVRAAGLTSIVRRAASGAQTLTF